MAAAGQDASATSPASPASKHAVNLAAAELMARQASPPTSAPSAEGSDGTARSQPSVYSVSPSSGSTLGGEHILITGSGFTNATGVTLNNAPVISFAVVNDTLITATTPPHAPATVHASVATALGTGSGGSYAYVTAPPVVSSVSPSSGSALGGEHVLITGSGFTGATAVSLGGAPVLRFVVISNSTISAVTAPHAAGTVSASVATPLGTGSGGVFSYVAAPPTITGISPSHGSTLGGDTLTITGAGFADVTAVTLGSTPVVSFAEVNDSTITVVTAPHAAGTVSATVATSLGTGSGGVFSYAAAPPTITGISPSHGSTLGGQSVAIAGDGFTGATSVSIGGVAVSGFVVVNDQAITAVTPPHAAGTVSATVATSLGTGSGGTFSYVAAPPTIAGVSPSHGSTLGGDSLTITGAGFSGATSVSVGGAAVVAFTVVSDDVITTTTPPHAAGTVQATVTTPLGTGTGGAFDYVAAAPVVVDISPSSASTVGGETVTITGTGFLGATAVSLDATPAPSFTVVSDDVITATTPPHAAGTVSATVTTPLGTGTGGAFTYFAATPVIVGISPSNGSTAGGQNIIITGTGFLGATSVSVGGVPVVAFTVVSDDVITTTTPPHAVGVVQASVTTPLGTGTGGAFAYDVPPPVISSVIPTLGPASGGTVVTITGSNLTAASQVVIGGAPATSFTVLDDSDVVATTAPHDPTTEPVAISTPHGSAVGPAVFTYTVPTPTVSGFTPAVGAPRGGTRVTITGTSFTGATAVSLADVPASSFRVVNDHTIVAVTAPHPPTSGRVAVTTEGGAGASSTDFRYQASAPAGPATG